MTHEYTILTGGRVLPSATADVGATAPGSGTRPAPTAIAWALDTILAIGGDAEVLAISRGDSRMASLDGRVVAPAPGGGELEPGDAAAFDILDASTGRVIAEVRAGRVVRGVIDGLGPALDACAPDA